MAGADQILKKIMDDARADASRTLKEAGEKAHAIKDRSKAASDAARKTAMAAAQGDAAQKRDRRLRMAALDARKDELSVKRELIGEAFDRALKSLLSQDVGTKTTLYQKMLLSAASGGEELIPSAADEAVFTPEFLSEANSVLKAIGKEPVTLGSGLREGVSGFVLVRGGMECNCSIEALLTQHREALEPEVARALYPSEEA